AFVCLLLTAAAPAAVASPMAGWTAPHGLDAQSNSVLELRVQPLPNGGAAAVWLSFDGLRTYITCSEFAPDSGWGQPTWSLLPNSANTLAFTANAVGDGVATWYDTGYSAAFASFFHAGRGL